MKIKLLISFMVCFVLTIYIAGAQVYPYSENFNSMSTFTNPSGWTSTVPGFQVYANHGTAGTNGMTKQMTTLGAVADSVISPLLGPLTSVSALSFDYRIMETNLYPSFAHTLTAGEMIELYAVNGTFIQQLGIIDLNNHLTSTAWATISIPLGSLVGNSGSLMIKVTRTSSDFFADFDNFSINDATGILQTVKTDEKATVYPNPSSNRTELNLKGVDAGIYKGKLTSACGKVMLEKNVTISSKESNLINTGLLNGGTYLLQLSGVRDNYAIKFVVKD